MTYLLADIIGYIKENVVLIVIMAVILALIAGLAVTMVVLKIKSKKLAPGSRR